MSGADVLVVDCPAWFSNCHCFLTEAHEIHECDCGGQWTGSDGMDELPVPVRFPQKVVAGPMAGMGVTDAIMAMLGFFGEDDEEADDDEGYDDPADHTIS